MCRDSQLKLFYLGNGMCLPRGVVKPNNAIQAGRHLL